MFLKLWNFIDVFVLLIFKQNYNANEMKIKADPIEQYLERLEQLGNDELRLFNDLDPTYYTIRHLLEVREHWIEQVHLFHKVMVLRIC